MNADIWFIDELSYRNISGHAGDLIRLLYRKFFRLHQEVHHLLYRKFRRICQIRIGRHRNEVGRGLGSRPGQPHTFSNGELNTAAKRGFDSRLIHLAIALGCMAIPDEEKCAGGENGNIECAPDHQLLIVEIARMPAWWVTAHAAGFWGRRHSHAAEKGT